MNGLPLRPLTWTAVATVEPQSGQRKSGGSGSESKVLFVHVPGIDKLATDEERTATTRLIEQAISAIVRRIATGP